MIVCIDTNAVLGMFGRAAPLLPLRHALLAGKFKWALSNEILLEYEEIAAREMGAAGVERMLHFIDLADQARKAILRISPTFRVSQTCQTSAARSPWPAVAPSSLVAHSTQRELVGAVSRSEMSSAHVKMKPASAKPSVVSASTKTISVARKISSVARGRVPRIRSRA